MSIVSDHEILTPGLPSGYFGPQLAAKGLANTEPTPVVTPGLTRGGSPRSSDNGENVRLSPHA